MYLRGMKNPHAQALGRLGGLARAQKMTPEDRQKQAESARYARTIKAKRRIASQAMQKDQFDE